MAFTVAAVSSSNANSTSHVVALPDGSNVVGRLVIVHFVVDGAPTLTWLTGWTQLTTGSISGDGTLEVRARFIDGTEGFTGTGDTITVTSSVNEKSSRHVYLISSGHHASTLPEAATPAAGGANVNPNPPSLTPSWGTAANLWLALSGTNNDTTHTAAPTNYTDLVSSFQGDPGGVGAGSARRELSALSEDPDPFTTSESRLWITTTVAVRPGGAAATDLVIQNATQAHTAGSLALTQTHSLTIAGATQGQSSDLVALTQQHQLVIADATQAHTADNLTLTAGAVNLVIQDATHAHTADGLALTQVHNLTVADATQAQAADNLTLTVSGVNLVIADTSHAHTADSLNLTQTHELTIGDATHGHTADHIEIEAVIPTFTFTPPTTGGIPTSIESKRDTDPSHRLWSYYDRWAMGQTVWKDSAGVWHAETWPEQGGDTTTIHEGGTTTVTAPREGLATAQVVYLGGHVYEITEDEAAELTAAGFGANIT